MSGRGSEIDSSKSVPLRGRLKRSAAIGSATALCLLALLAVLGVYDITAPYRYDRQLVGRLRSIDDRQSAERAVGALGVVLDHPDGSWTAITYKDAHSFGYPSVAIARTSDGRWYKAREHHCGLFVIYSGLRADRQQLYSDAPDARYWKDRDARLVLLHQIETVPDPVRQTGLLAELGFTAFR